MVQAISKKPLNALSLDRVIQKAGNAVPIAYVFEAPIHYIVLTRKDNTFNGDFIKEYMAVLDEIEATEGPGILVTIGTGEKHFSTGFDLDYWCKSFEDHMTSVKLFYDLMAKLLEFPMPTMCIFNGNAFAGGYLLGLCYDTRIMNEAVGDICLSELKLGIALPLPMMLVCKAKLGPNVCLRLVKAIVVPPSEALKDGMIDATYSSVGDLENQMTAYCKRYAPLGASRLAMKMNK